MPRATVVLAAGHGGVDPGACNGEFTERDEAIKIVGWIAEILRGQGVNVFVTDNSLDTHQTIPEVNKKFGAAAHVWALEVHRDSASGLEESDASFRCGVYTGDSTASKTIGLAVLSGMKSEGANNKSWCRSHTGSRHGSLGWIRQVQTMSHLLELGFMEGRNDDTHLRKLACIGAAGVLNGLEAFCRIRGCNK